MISVILLTHNYANYLSECLDSILKNDISLIGEIIIINDYSTDNTDQVVIKYQTQTNKIRYYKTKFLSLNKSYNFGVSKSNFEFITKIDADDSIEKNFISNFFSKLKEKDYDFIFGDIRIVDSNGNFISVKKQRIDFIKSFTKYPLGSGTIYKKNIWKQLGGFDEKIKYQDDYDFWLKIKRLKNVKIGYLSEQGYNYRKHNNNMSKNIFKKNLTKLFVFLRGVV
jgi:glycosyltransferase involved in cell wall biosynthesis|tara:strand:+ start:1664 stop:2335 length:672 start_codon:yes stop_codon:yes gene_type:complete